MGNDCGVDPLKDLIHPVASSRKRAVKERGKPINCVWKEFSLTKCLDCTIHLSKFVQRKHPYSAHIKRNVGIESDAIKSRLATVFPFAKNWGRARTLLTTT
jgi:hypothetical protein